MANNNYFLTFLLTLLVALAGLSTDIYLPSLPTIIHYYKTDMTHVQLTLSMYMAGSAICMLLSGPLSDRFGRRPIILLGLFIHFISTLACLFSSSIEMLIAARFFQALGGGSGTVLSRVIVKDKFSDGEIVKILAWIAAGMALSPAIAPLLGGVIETYSTWKLSFIILALLSFFLFVWVYFFLDESLNTKNLSALNIKKLSSNYLLALQDKNYLTYTLVISFAWTGYFSFLSVSAFIFMKQLHTSSIQYGFLYGLTITAYIMGNFLARKFSSQLSISAIVFYSTALACIAGASLLITHFYCTPSIITIMLPMIFYLIAAGIIMPNAQAGALESFKHASGSVAGLLYFIEMSFGAIAGLIIGYFSENQKTLFVIIIAGSSFAMFSLFYILKWHYRQSDIVLT
jgi:DHA1 family bicyclomycin/chloramphenicol resistance-like MFS transporter